MTMMRPRHSWRLTEISCTHIHSRAETSETQLTMVSILFVLCTSIRLYLFSKFHKVAIIDTHACHPQAPSGMFANHHVGCWGHQMMCHSIRVNNVFSEVLRAQNEVVTMFPRLPVRICCCYCALRDSQRVWIWKRSLSPRYS
jgi:hypothetical protein